LYRVSSFPQNAFGAQSSEIHNLLKLLLEQFGAPNATLSLIYFGVIHHSVSDMYLGFRLKKFKVSFQFEF